MRLLLLSLFALVYLASGSPTCVNFDWDSCKSKRPTVTEYFPEYARDLDPACPDILGELSCKLRLIDRCPESQFAIYRPSVVESENLFKKLCSKTDLRQVYLRNIGCLSKLNKMLFIELKRPSVDIDLCKRSKALLETAREKAVNKCGEEAGDVSDALLKPIKTGVKAVCE